MMISDGGKTENKYNAKGNKEPLTFGEVATLLLTRMFLINFTKSGITLGWSLFVCQATVEKLLQPFTSVQVSINSHSVYVHLED